MIPAHQVASTLITTSKQKGPTSLNNLAYSLTNRENQGYFAKKQKVFAYKKSVEAALAQNNYTQAILDCEAIYRLTVPYLLSFNEKIISNHYQLACESSIEKPDWIEYRRLGNDLLQFVITHYGMRGLVTLTLAGSEWALANLSFYALHAKKNIPLNVVCTERLMQLKQENLPLYYYFSIILTLAQRSDSLCPALNQRLMEQSVAALKEFQAQVDHLTTTDQAWFSIIQIHYFLMLGIPIQDITTIMLQIIIAIENQIVFAVPMLLNFCQVYLPTYQSNNLSCLFWLNAHLLGANKIPLPDFINKQFAEICLSEHKLRPNASYLLTSFYLTNLRLPTTRSAGCVLELDICTLPIHPVYDFRPSSLDNFLGQLVKDDQMISFDNVTDEWKNSVRELHIPELARIIQGDQAYQIDVSIILLKWSALLQQGHSLQFS